MVTTSARTPPTWRARQLRRVAVFVCLPGILIGVCMGAVAFATGLLHHETRPCPVPVVRVVARSSFVTTVLNGSGSRPGLARTAATSLKHAGFRVGVVGNAPELRWTDEPAVIWHGPDGLAQAQLVATQIPGAQLVGDQRAGTSVEVVLGTRYRSAAQSGSATASATNATDGARDLATIDRCG
jgi:LytR cell envelope-related transcriptional attenuator